MPKLIQQGSFIREEDAPSSINKRMGEFLEDKEAKELWDRREEQQSWTHQKIRAKRAT